jgi:hypothetical protein
MLARAESRVCNFARNPAGPFPKCAARRYRARLYTRREWARVGGVDRTVPVVGGAEEIGEREINA